MGEFMPDDICEQILVRLDVKDLIRYKSVCKSWKSLLTCPRFAKAHYRRQVNLVPCCKDNIPSNYFNKYGPEYYMVGSSNGLACITSFDGNEIIVANPWTREERMLQKPKVSYQSCWGFGYDSLTDDYKVVYGTVKHGGKTDFHVLSLKSNVWKHVGDVNYTCVGVVSIGTLCNEALHWFMFGGGKGFIMSFDLSKEVFKEINQPSDATRECHFLAINIRGMKKFNIKLKWKNKSNNYYTLGHSYRALRIDFKDPYTFIPTSVLPSLISPHLQEDDE